MISILANTDTNIAEFIPEYPFYLFVFKDDCKEYKFFLSDVENCNGMLVFLLNINIPMGEYELKIYGTFDVDEINTDELDLLSTDDVKVYNPESICFAMPFLLDENGYPIEDNFENKILR